MNSKAIRITAATLLTAVAAAITIYTVSHDKKTMKPTSVKDNAQMQDIKSGMIREASAEIEENNNIYYLLKDEKGKLNLYQVGTEDIKIIKSLDFNSSFLPEEDRHKLFEGIVIEHIEKAYELIEDFTS